MAGRLAVSPTYCVREDVRREAPSARHFNASPKAGLLIVLLALSSYLCLPMPSHADDINRLANATFDKDLSHWTMEGKAIVETDAPLEGSGSLRLGPGQCVVSQRYAIEGLRIVYFGATFQAEVGISAEAGKAELADVLVRARCYDSRGHLLMEQKQSIDPQKVTAKGVDAGVYFKTQGKTAYLVVSLEKTGKAPGSVRADFAKLVDYDHDRIAHAPLCNPDQSMQPVWEGKTVYDETVLPFSEGEKPAQGRLLFAPTKIVAVRSGDLSKTYREGVDYTISGNVLTIPPGSSIPVVRAADISAGELAWYEIGGKHLAVTYTHDAAWQGPIPHYEGEKLPETMRLLRQHLPLTVVAYGDSITLGMNVSGYMQYAPYMPTWVELFVRRLTTAYGDKNIHLYNTALGGQTSAWGKENAESAVATLDPDLVIIAFGMNDFWWMPGEEFQRNIQETMRLIRVHNPRAEFILVSSMPFDPAYTAVPAYREHMASYVTALRSLTGKGACLLDMNAIGAALFAAKRPKDLIANPLHPNDFLARWYAQGLAAMLLPPAPSKRVP